MPKSSRTQLLVVNKLGDESDRKRTVELLADRTVIVSDHRFNKVRISTQLCDLALASLLYHAKEDFRKYGLPPFQFHPTTVLNVRSIGFPSDAARDKAISDWRNDHPLDEEQDTPSAETTTRDSR